VTQTTYNHYCVPPEVLLETTSRSRKPLLKNVAYCTEMHHAVCQRLLSFLLLFVVVAMSLCHVIYVWVAYCRTPWAAGT